MSEERTSVRIKTKTATILRRYKRELKKCKSIDDVIGVLKAGYENSLTKVEIKKPMLTQDGDLAESVPCLSRFDFEDLYYCGKSAPKIVALVTLKVCSACRFRITKEGLAELKEREKVTTSFYLNCGAKERQSNGTTLVFCDRCPDQFIRSKWHSTNSCKISECPMFKMVVGAVKK